LGDQFLQNKQNLVLKVPSAIVRQESNFLLNPLHAKFKKIRIVSSELLQLDKRLSEY
jgi:RES domain-containing protein